MDVTRRYQVCKFPGLYGTPWETDVYALAWCYAWTRYLLDFLAYCVGGHVHEIRLTDTMTNTHKVW